MKKVVQMPVVRYRAKDNEPTCACDFPTGEVCQFYRTNSFGCHETCVFAPEGQGGKGARLRRRGEKRIGTLVPGDWCPVWKDEDKEADDAAH